MSTITGQDLHRGIYVEIDEMRRNIERLRIEVDIKCNDKKKYRQLMRTQILTQKKRVYGVRVFEGRDSTRK